MCGKGVYIFITVAVLAFQINGEADRKFSFASVASSVDNLQQVRNQINELRKNVNDLVSSNQIGNTLDILNSARASINQAISEANASNPEVLLWFNVTASSIVNSINGLANTASENGVNVTNCTQNNNEEITNLTLHFATGLVNCPVQEANKGLAMIDRDVQYVTDLANMTITLPQTISNCNSHVKCLVHVIGKYSVTIGQAPVKLSLMTTEVTTYVSMIQTNLGVCAANSTFASLSEVTSWGVNETVCISELMVASGVEIIT